MRPDIPGIDAIESVFCASAMRGASDAETMSAARNTSMLLVICHGACPAPGVPTI